MIKVSKQLQKVIKSSGLSQAKIARESRVDPAILSRFLNGNCGVSGKTFDKLCNYMNMELKKK